MKKSYVYHTKVVRIIDGDTFVGSVDLGFDITVEIKFRLKGIDTPEIYRPTNEAEREHGRLATEFVESLILGQTVLCDVLKYGKYGRSIVDVYITDDDMESGTTLSQILIENNFEKKETY